MPKLHELALERPQQTFNTGVVPAVAGATHAGDHAMGGEHLLVTHSGILAHAIRVVQPLKSRIVQIRKVTGRLHC